MNLRKPTFDVEKDFEGNQELYDRSMPIFDKAWADTNANALVGQETIPQLRMSDWGDIGDGAAASRIYLRKMDEMKNAGGGEKSIGAEVAERLANGTMTQQGAANNYLALAQGALDKADGMGSFSYDFNKDPIFKMLSASYMQQARDAASNASALAAARTGGYGNSYGAAAAAQQYNRALGNLYDQVPELQQAAYNRWQNDQNRLLNQADRYLGMATDAYQRGVNEEERDYNRAWNEDERAYQRGWNEDERTYQRGQDEKTWKWNEEGRQHDWKNEEWQRQMDQAAAAANLGNYEPMEKLLGVDLSQAKSTDAVNKFLSVLSAVSGFVGEEERTSLLSSLINSVEQGDGNTVTGDEYLDGVLRKMFGGNGQNTYGIDEAIAALGIDPAAAGYIVPSAGGYYAPRKPKSVTPEKTEATPEKTEDPVAKAAEQAVTKQTTKTSYSGGGYGGGYGTGYGTGYGGGYGGGYQAGNPGGATTVTEYQIPETFYNTIMNMLQKKK